MTGISFDLHTLIITGVIQPPVCGCFNNQNNTLSTDTTYILLLCTNKVFFLRRGGDGSLDKFIKFMLPHECGISFVVVRIPVIVGSVEI